MTFNDAVKRLEKSKTPKGNYKPNAVHLLIKELTTTRPCPNCDGKGETHSPCAFGGSGDYHECRVCEGVGRI